MERNWKKIMKRVALILLMPVIIMAFVFANMMSKNNVCQGLDIHIANSDKVNFVTAKDLQQLLDSKNVKYGNTKLKDINIEAIEAVVLNNPWVKDANIYIDNKDKINMNITQKEPVMRWLNGSINQNYLDENTNPIPVNNSYSAPVPVLTSNKLGFSLADMETKRQMVTISKFILQDSFWNAMISQIHLNPKREFELINNVANHTILFGDTNNMQNKFDRLFTFYKEIIPRAGWEKYKSINVMFDGQIVTELTDEAMAILEKEKHIKPGVLASTIKKSSTIKGNAIISKKKIETTKKKVEVINAKPKPKTDPLKNKKLELKKTQDKKINKETTQKVSTKK